jgi:alkylresorcinol/alkylpyrone synthase
VADRTPRPKLVALATAVPPYRIDQQDVIDRAPRLFPACGRGTVERLLPVYGNSGVATRYSCVPPDWYERPHGWAEKNRLYLVHAVALIAEAATACLAKARLDASDIDAVVAVSTTGIATPSLDALAIDRLGLRPDVTRLPIFGLGCGGGVTGLARAATLASAQPGSRVLFLVVELCGLTFRRADATKSNVVATALFGDGAAAAIVSTDGDGPAFGRAGEHTWPGSLDVMGWLVEDDGLGVRFSRDIPALARSEFRDAAERFLARSGYGFADIDTYVCHPGGAKVLDALEAAFGLAPGGLADSRAVLRDFGNMSAATILFVLDRVLGAPARGRHLLSALGPGFTATFLEMVAS